MTYTRLLPFALLLSIAFAAWWFILRERSVEVMQLSEDERATSRSLVIAGGCFWCVESDFDHVPGVLATTSGYAGGTLADPTYKQVVAGGTGHYEVVKVDYDPRETTFDALLTAFWHSVDPTDPGGQFCDRGQSYATAIFVEGEEERIAAQASKQALLDDGVDIVTPILANAAFYPAEEYHQDYYLKNPARYAYYRNACGRTQSVKALWGDAAYQGIDKG